jgi:hypothetical protein
MIPMDKKIKNPVTEGQNGFIFSLNENELLAGADDQNPSTPTPLFQNGET